MKEYDLNSHCALVSDLMKPTYSSFLLGALCVLLSSHFKLQVLGEGTLAFSTFLTQSKLYHECREYVSPIFKQIIVPNEKNSGNRMWACEVWVGSGASCSVTHQFCGLGQMDQNSSNIDFP